MRDMTGERTPDDPEAARLLEAIEADLDGTDAYLVFGDYLQTRGDPRGELIALQHARARRRGDGVLDEEEATLLGTHAGSLFGPLAPFIVAPRYGRAPFAVAWHLGF